MNFNAAGEDPKALGHFLITDFPAQQVQNDSATQKVRGILHPLPCSSHGRHSPGRLVERNGANVQLLDLIDGANGEGAVVGQCQAGKKGLGLD